MSKNEDTHNTQGTPDEDMDADTASGGAPDKPDRIALPETTDENDRPVDNPSG
ncbi:hypothetical protein ITJ43_08315 [Microbacterium sp. VKM Ac-2870]|jgi:hypothetical protein|uniref:hypothetical protein n=1 Tax=Microbacterium sp. VKM Ac-2870 TaxID=2783825 RepID=UPI00188B609B|nr:hypothetical protein [Microbacterium sp. VKM Ac-2870]MBF4562143.1 hypothetical protein [Microbacterium sp. VKM Ac-2870]